MSPRGRNPGTHAPTSPSSREMCRVELLDTNHLRQWRTRHIPIRVRGDLGDLWQTIATWLDTNRRSLPERCRSLTLTLHLPECDHEEPTEPVVPG